MDLHGSDPSSALTRTPGHAGAAAPPGEAPASSPVPDAPPAAGPSPKAETAAVRAKKRRRARRRRFDLPAWAVSFLVHVVILSLLGAATFSREVQTAVASINSALVGSENSVNKTISERWLSDAPSVARPSV